MTTRRRMIERRLKLRRRLIKQVARCFYERVERQRRLADELVESIAPPDRGRCLSAELSIHRPHLARFLRCAILYVYEK